MVAPAIIGAGISAVGSVLGGLLGGKEKGKSKTKSRSKSLTTHDVDLKKMVRQAEKAGFNPLTVLQAGGLSAYTSSRTVGSSISKTKGSSTSTAPLGAGIAAAAGAIGGAVANAPDAQAFSAAAAWQAPSGARAANAAEYDLVQQQLQQVQPGELGTQPSFPVSRTFKAPGGALSGGEDGGVMKPTFEASTVTNPFPVGSGMGVNPNFTDAEGYEKRYGGSEIAEMIGGGIVAGGDLWHGGKQAVDHLVNHDLPNMKKRAGELYNSAVEKNAINNALGMKVQPGGRMPIPTLDEVKTFAQDAMPWDPPAIKMFVPPVVEHHPEPALWDRVRGASEGIMPW